MSDLKFINETSISSGVTTIDVDNVFSSNYDVYFCQIIGLHHNTDVSNGVEGIRLIDNSGSVVTQSEYEYATQVLKGETTFQEVISTSNTFMSMYLITDQQTDGQASASFYFYQPYNTSSYTFMQYQSMGKNSSSTWGGKGIAVHKGLEAIRGFQLYESNAARTFGGGVIRVYGIS